jgi:SWI/SNF-related matrix-associated actin-dependent regulator of chromatin subfamily A3
MSIRSAVVKGRIDAADISNTAQSVDVLDRTLDVIATSTPTLSQGSQAVKRKTSDRHFPAPSQPGPSSQTLSSQHPAILTPGLVPSSQTIEIDDDEGDDEDEPGVDELYCQMKTNIVGVQYYQGDLYT